MSGVISVSTYEDPNKGAEDAANAKRKREEQAVSSMAPDDASKKAKGDARLGQLNDI